MAESASSAPPDEAEKLSVFIGTWNVGNKAPKMDACLKWLAKARGKAVQARP